MSAVHSAHLHAARARKKDPRDARTTRTGERRAATKKQQLRLAGGHLIARGGPHNDQSSWQYGRDHRDVFWAELSELSAAATRLD